MSINDLIHTNAHNAFEQGVKTERERIVKLLETLAVQQQKVLDFNARRKDASGREIVIATAYQLVALIKGEQK